MKGLTCTVSQIAVAPHVYFRSVRAPLSEFRSPHSAHGRHHLSAPDPEPPVGAPSPRARARSLTVDCWYYNQESFPRPIPGRSLQVDPVNV
eukprot:1798415-Pleurochrysis_carterae.AAC.1